MNAAQQVKPEIPRGAGDRQPKVVIIGAGMSGILMGIKLREAGIDNFTLYEKADRVGGTWRDNTYPGLSCDVPAHMYTYSFEANPDYSHRYARGPEIYRYFDKVSKKYNLLPHIKFNKELVSAKYENGRWQLTTQDGEVTTADFLISACGVLHHPSYPDIAGLDSFAGTKFHTARWDHSVDLKGKRIGIIGTGSTSAQIVPKVVDVAGKLSLFQRTPQWMFPLPDKQFSEDEKNRMRESPFLPKLVRKLWSFAFEYTFARAVIGNPLLLQFIAWSCRRNLDQVKDPILKRKLTPDYKAACKRLIFCSDFYPAIQRPNAELVTAGIDRIDPKGIVTKDGKLHELDVLVLATGFKPHNFMRPMQMVGENGVTLDQAWENGAQAYRSIGIPGFPNFFMLIGPNSPIGNYSLITIAEIQANYILQLIGLYRQGKCAAIAPKAEATRRFNEAIKGAMKGTVWVTGCKSWYLDKNGNPAMWPWTFARFRHEMSTPQLAEFQLQAPQEIAATLTGEVATAH